jgi:hydroxymethylpyrimidine pyrophosphatase-like HAD family hydrolase
MKLAAVALDYDGTIAEDGELGSEVRAAIYGLRRSGVAIILVTGRMLSDLRMVAGSLAFADAVVAENGAVLAFPHSGHARLLAAPPPQAFLDALRRRGVPFGAGQCVIDTDAAYAPRVLAAIQRLALPLVILFNGGRLMVLPQGVSKATGLHAALKALRVSEHNTIGIGNAENDHVLLRACGVGVAVQWGSPALVATADGVVPGKCPRDIAPYLQALSGQTINGPVLNARSEPLRSGARRSRVTLGLAEDGRPVVLPPGDQNILLVGDSVSGKSWVAGLLCEQWLMQRYSLCVVDPEGDYGALQAIPDVVCLGRTAVPPSLSEVVSALRHPDVSLVVDLSQVHRSDKSPYVSELLSQITVLRQATGRPHRLVLDEAHYFVDEAAFSVIDLTLGGNVFVTYRAASLPMSVHEACPVRIATRLTRPREIEALRACEAESGRATDWADALPSLAIGEAMLLPLVGGEGEAARVQLPPRQTDHVRHQVKYLSVPVPSGREFVFTRGGQPTGYWANTVRALAVQVRRLPDDVLVGHLSRGDLSRWIAEVYVDDSLAAEIRGLEHVYEYEALAEVRAALARLIESRYTAFDDTVH